MKITLRILGPAALISLLWVAPVTAQSSDRPDGMRFVPDVIGQFEAQSERSDALGFRIGASPDPSSCKHYQAITRFDGPDHRPFLLVTRSGNLPSTLPFPGAVCNDSDGETGNGHLIIFDLGSRDRNGERFRSNKLEKGTPIQLTTPLVDDRARTHWTFVGGDPADPDPAKRPGLVFRDGEGAALQNVFQHAGGMQLVGHMLGVALETPLGIAGMRTLVMFVDVSNPLRPVFTSQFEPRDDQGEMLQALGTLGVTPLPGGRYLMAVTGGSSTTLHFYRSTLDDLSSPDLAWERVGQAPVPPVNDAHQTLNFLREGNIDGDLYLIGARGSANPFADDHDRADLYLVECRSARQLSPNCEPGDDVEVTEVRRRRVVPNNSSSGGIVGGILGREVNLAAASGFYVSPSGELIMYATEHDNDGPSGSVKAGEWRHIDMVRANSPTLLPTAVVNGPYAVDEGRSVNLDGSAGSPITKAWIELFNELDFGGGEFSGLYAVVDFDDYDLDDYDDLSTFEAGLHLDRARSSKWFAPEGCAIRLTDHRADGSIETRTLVGDGFLHNDADLAQILNDHGDGDMAPGGGGKGVDGVSFLSGCNTYYEAPVNLQWDLNVDGIFETTGSPVSFDATAFDGPVTVDVPAQALHPSGGAPGQTTARVTVRNVAPELTRFRLTNGAGQELNVAVPFALTNLPVTVGADYIDPGVLDHQTATLAWGDGTVDPSTVFTAFDEAFGDASGSLSHSHVFTLPGSYQIALTVQDDDGGSDAKSTIVRVVTPEQALEEILDLLDGVIAGTTDNRVLRELEKARKALAGNPQGESANGALDKLRADLDHAAIAFVRQAIVWLQRSQAEGADVATLIALLEQVAVALGA